MDTIDTQIVTTTSMRKTRNMKPTLSASYRLASRTINIVVLVVPKGCEYEVHLDKDAAKGEKATDRIHQKRLEVPVVRGLRYQGFSGIGRGTGLIRQGLSGTPFQFFPRIVPNNESGITMIAQIKRHTIWR